MGRRVAHIAMGALAIVLVQASTAAPLRNPGFEDAALAPWFQGVGTLDRPHDEFWSVTQAEAASGTWSAQNVGNNELRQDFAAIPVASVLEVSFSLRQEGTGALGAAVQLHYADGSFTQQQFVPSGLDLWQRYDVTSQLDPGKQLTGVSFFGIRSSLPTRTHLDDVRVLVPEPGSFVLVALGLGLLTARRPTRRHS